MSKILVTYPDVERLVVDFLDPLLSTVDVGIQVPAGWTPGDAAHVQVALDGTPIVHRFLAQMSTIRLTARAADPTDAKSFLQLASAHLLHGPWPDGITNARPLTGPLPARDPDTLAELASATFRVTVRSTPLADV